MRKEIISFDKASSTQKVKNGELYLIDDVYYKIFSNVVCSGFYVLDGLDLNFMGTDQLSLHKVGLINDITSSAFIDIITDNNICCGYAMHKGTLVQDKDSDYIKFVKELAHISNELNHAYTDMRPSNVIKYNGKCSLIDLETSPMKLRHSKVLNNFEKEFWLKDLKKCNYYFSELQSLGMF
jgi:hypothetical protein